MSSNFPDWMVVEGDGWGDDDVVEQMSGYSFYEGTEKLFFDPGPHVYFKYDAEGNRQDVDGVTTVLSCVAKPFLVPWATKLAVECLQGYLINKETGAINPFTTEQLHQWLHEAKNKHKERLETAGDIGHLAHECLEKTIQYAIDHTDGIVLELRDLPVDDIGQDGTWEPDPNKEMVRNCVNAAWDWMKAHNVRWIATERKIYSREYNFAGTEDGICIMDSCDDLQCCRGKHFRDTKAIGDFKSSNQISDTYAYQTAAYLMAEVEEFEEYISLRVILRLGKTDGKFETWLLTPDSFEADLNAFLSCLGLHRSLKEITERRKVERAELRAIIKSIKDAEKEARLAQEKAERFQAKLLRMQATKERNSSKDALYRTLRAQGVSVVDAKAQVAIEFPPRAKEESEDEVEPIPVEHSIPDADLPEGVEYMVKL